MRLVTVFCPWWRIGELRVENAWLLEGWNRACVINDGIRDALERSHERYGDLLRDHLATQARGREMAEELGALRALQNAQPRPIEGNTSNAGNEGEAVVLRDHSDNQHPQIEDAGHGQ
jgi:hypothetical protein